MLKLHHSCKYLNITERKSQEHSGFMGQFAGEMFWKCTHQANQQKTDCPLRDRQSCPFGGPFEE